MHHVRSPREVCALGRIASIVVLAIASALLPVSGAAAQIGDTAPVALDDSPVASRLLAEVVAQSLDNPERAATLLGELLDQYAGRVVASEWDSDRFESVRRAVLRILAEDGAVRDAWRRRFEIDAESMLAAGRIDQCLERRPMTDAGLEAGLRMAQRIVEREDPAAARRLLRSLADWPGASAAAVADRIELLQALAWIATVADDPTAEAIDRCQDAMGAVGRWNPELADRLAAIAAANEPVGSPPPGSPFDRSWTSLWEAPLEASLFRNRTIDRATGRAVHPDPEMVRLDGRYLVTLPAVAGDLVLVNEGRVIEALDRYTGRLRWYRDHGVGRLNSGSGVPLDLCEIVVADGDAYTITGHAFPGGRGGERSIIRFDPSTGLERWEVRPDRLNDHPELEDAEPCGPPIVIGDLVMVPLRRTTPRLETIDLVMALDRSDGAVRWIRTIASSGSTRVGDPRPGSRLTSVEGDVLIASAAGATARLDGRTGEVLWLHRDEVPLVGSGQTPYAWQITGPVVIEQGIVALDAARRHWQLLDPGTGEVVLRRPIGPGTTAGAARWLSAARGSDDRDLLLAVGDDVIAIDPDAPDRAVWSWRNSVDAARLDSASPLALQVRGRVFVDRATHSLLVPTTTGVFAVDTRDGRSERVLELDGPVNPVITADAIHAAGGDGLVTAMPVLEAVATLESRLRASPDAVPQAIALLELAERIGRPDLLRFAATAAVDGLALPEGEQWRGEVLDLLLATVPAVNDEDGVVLLGLAAQAATDVSGRVRHRLAEAAWLESRGRTREAADAWLAIMGDAESSAVMVRAGESLEVSAGSVARDRLVGALEREPEWRARLELEAISEVEAALAARETAEVFIDLARRWPGTNAAVRAASRAVEILRDEGEPSAVLAVGLVLARDLPSDDPRRAQLLEKAAVACEEVGATGPARVLRLASGDAVPTLPPRARLEGLPDHLELLPGRLASVAPSVTGRSPSDLALLFEPDSSQLVALDAPDMHERWRLPVQADHLVIGWTPELLVWQGLQRREPFLTAVDPTTGEVRWSTPQASRLLPPISRFAVQSDGFLPDGEVFLPYDVIPIPLDEGILLVRRDGAASMVDRVDGQTILWSRRDLMDRVYGATAGGGLVHLHGAGVDDRGDKVGRVVSLDPTTGRTVLDEVISIGEVQWLLAEELGRIAVGTRSEIRMLDPVGRMLGGGDRWTRRNNRLEQGVVGWMTERDLVIADDSGRISGWDLAGGRAVADRWLLPDDEGEVARVALGAFDLGDRRVLHLDGRLILHDRAGRLLGADALAAPSRRDWRMTPIDGGLLLATRLSSGSGSQVIRFQRLDPDAGLKLVGTPFEIEGRTRYEDMRAVEGRLLLSTGAETHVLPMSPRREVTPDSDPGP